MQGGIAPSRVGDLQRHEKIILLTLLHYTILQLLLRHFSHMMALAFPHLTSTAHFFDIFLLLSTMSVSLIELVLVVQVS